MLKNICVSSNYQTLHLSGSHKTDFYRPSFFSLLLIQTDDTNRKGQREGEDMQQKFDFDPGAPRGTIKKSEAARLSCLLVPSMGQTPKIQLP